MAWARSPRGLKILKFGAVSAINVFNGQVLLYGAQVLGNMQPVVANAFAVSIGTIPAYILSRYWVWEKRGKNHFMREVLPFWILALAGFAASTAAIWFVDNRWEPGPLAINLTSLTAYGVVWVVKFVVLDRFLWKSEEATATEPAPAST